MNCTRRLQQKDWPAEKSGAKLAHASIAPRRRRRRLRRHCHHHPHLVPLSAQPRNSCRLFFSPTLPCRKVAKVLWEKADVVVRLHLQSFFPLFFFLFFFASLPRPPLPSHARLMPYPTVPPCFSFFFLFSDYFSLSLPHLLSLSLSDPLRLGLCPAENPPHCGNIWCRSERQLAFLLSLLVSLHTRRQRLARGIASVPRPCAIKIKSFISLSLSLSGTGKTPARKHTMAHRRQFSLKLLARGHGTRCVLETSTRKQNVALTTPKPKVQKYNNKIHRQWLAA